MRDTTAIGEEPAIQQLAATVAAATAVVPVGARTQFEVGGDVATAVEVHAPTGILDVAPADMTVTVRAGTSFAELDLALRDHGQECPLDPPNRNATIGGILATGLSGLRRLGLGPVRDAVLEVVFVTADGRVVRGGGPTVKNVTGYDIPRLFVGSLGTLGVLVQATLRTRPRPGASEWFRSAAPAADLRGRLFNPTTIVSGRAGITVCLEGNAADIEAQARAAALEPCPLEAAAVAPVGGHRGRISVDPRRIAAVESALGAIDSVEWLAEWGVGTIHVATNAVPALAQARDVAHANAGWMLRESGARALDPFGVAFPATDLQRRIRHAVDPTGKLSPGRVPATEAA